MRELHPLQQTGAGIAVARSVVGGLTFPAPPGEVRVVEAGSGALPFTLLGGFVARLVVSGVVLIALRLVPSATWTTPGAIAGIVAAIVVWLAIAALGALA